MYTTRHSSKSALTMIVAALSCSHLAGPAAADSGMRPSPALRLGQALDIGTRHSGNKWAGMRPAAPKLKRFCNEPVRSYGTSPDMQAAIFRAVSAWKANRATGYSNMPGGLNIMQRVTTDRCTTETQGGVRVAKCTVFAQACRITPNR